MKKLLLVLLFIFFCDAFSQESDDKIIYLDSLQKEVTVDNFKVKRIIKEYNLEKKSYKVLEYSANDTLIMQGFYSDKTLSIRNGEFISYHKNGKKENSTIYVEGSPKGKVTNWYDNGFKKEEGEYTNEDWKTGKSFKILQYWDENNIQKVLDGNGEYSNTNLKTEWYFKGNLKNGYNEGTWTGGIKDKYSFTETYKEGKLISGVKIKSDNEKIEYSELETRPVPKKGINQFYKYIGNNFNYSDSAIKKKIQGKIILQFIVDKTGKIVEPKIVKGLGYGLDQEAIRVLISYEDWIPGMQRGENVRVKYSLPLTLKTP